MPLHLARHRTAVTLAAANIAAATLTVPPAVAAQTWPQRPVTLITAAAAGTPPDVVARVLAARLAPRWGQAVVIDNRPGAAGNLATAAAVRAAPDGYTLLFSQAAPLALNRATFARLPFDVARDTEPVIAVAESPLIVAVRTDLAAHDLGGLIALAKRRPGRLDIATLGADNIPHLALALIKARAGVDIVHVPYRSSQRALADVVAGRIDGVIDGAPTLLALAAAGRLRALASTAPRRLPQHPDLPAVAETLPGYSVTGWFAVLAPRGIDPLLLARINADMDAVLREPAVVSRLNGLGIYPLGGTPSDLAALIDADTESLARAAAAAGLARR